MARIPFIAGNWKMNKTTTEAVALVRELMPRVQGLDKVKPDDWPPLAIVHLAFQLMVGCGFAMQRLEVFRNQSTGM